MNAPTDSAAYLVEQIQRKAPEYLDLLTASNEQEFEEAFEALLERAVTGLEANSRNFASLDEVGLSATLALALGIPGLAVTQEAHSNGHVDLTIVADHCTPARRKLGEAKIWHGPAYHIAGLEQLLGRYTTGREGRGLVIAYVKQKNIAGLISELRTRMDQDRPYGQTDNTSPHRLKWSFVSRHTHPCGEALAVGHIGCNLYTEPASGSEA